MGVREWHRRWNRSHYTLCVLPVRRWQFGGNVWNELAWVGRLLERHRAGDDVTGSDVIRVPRGRQRYHVLPVRFQLHG